MSDTRQDAAQDLEDALGSSLSSSFAPPPAPVRPAPATEVGTTQASGAVEAEEEQASAPVPGMDEWKSTYDAYVTHWQAESAVARDLAERNRKMYEDEAEAKAKKSKDEAAAKKKAAAKEKKEQEDAERLRRELAGEGSVRKSAQGKGKEERERKVKEAWELVKESEGAGGKGGDGVVHAGDARGVMDEDVKAGQAVGAGQHRERIAQTAYDPTTSTEPLPPSMQESGTRSPAQPSTGITSQTLSRHSATSQAWEEISASPSSGEDLSPPGSGSGLSSDDNVRRTPAASAPAPAPKPTVSRSQGQPSQSESQQPSQNQPPANPPSLTLSLFTSPESLSVSRIAAVLGINLVLPFINGVMLGFGELFAREVFRFGRLVFHGERTLFGWRRGGEQRGGARDVAGVGLSGSGGFP